ncbi:MAG: LysR family transcriptional regulator [Opitutae bacterium]|nr:LysR family transcriptional regulator [Opitutae bacterium]
MELRHLKTFLAAAETLSISAASRQLRVTQPALSRQIQDLEAEVGQPLFVRHPGGLKLTPAGVELRDRGARVIAAHDDALRAVRADPPAAAHLRLAYSPTLHMWTRFMAPAVTRLQARETGLTSTVQELVPGKIIAGLRAGDIDVGMFVAGTHPNIVGVTCELAVHLPVSAVVAVDHPLAKRRQLEIEDFRDQEVIGFSEESFPGRDLSFRQRCREAGFEPRIHRVGDSLLDALVIGRQRGALGIAASLGLKSFIPGVVFVPIRPPSVTFPLFVASTDAIAAAGKLREQIVAEAARVARAP